MNFSLRIPAILFLLSALLIGPYTAAAEPDAQWLAPAESALEQADSAEASLLAPVSYAKGLALLERARRSHDSGAPASEIAAQVNEASNSLATAVRVAGETRSRLEQSLARRERAREADAFRLAGKLWIEAEGVLLKAASHLEAGDVSRGLDAGAAAGRLYQAAHAQAAKAGVLTTARSLVLSLDEAGSGKLAPKTTEKAQELLRQAEAELDADPERIETAARLANDAAGEARHALALTELLRSARQRDATSEDLLLEWESGLGAIGGALGSSGSVAEGPLRAAAEIAEDAAALRSRAERQAVELAERERQIAALEQEIRELDEKFAGASLQARNLGIQAEAREHERQRYESLERLFPPGEASVLRQGNQVIVRLGGLAFASGSARLTPSAESMMTKLREAAMLYPSASIAIEGHTDSSGDSGANQRLSQKRAEAVRAWLVQNLQVPAGRLTAIGLGDSRPIASNETETGRRANRRIDLVITPRDGASY